MSFENPTDLARCIHSDCQSYRAGGTPFCAQHLREQEQKSAGIVEPEVEERARAAGDAVMAEQKTYVLMDPDVNGGAAVSPDPDLLYHGYRETDQIPDSAKELLLRPDPAELEPYWDGSQWVLRPKRNDPDLNAVRSLVRDLMYVLGIREEGGDDHA